jgi:MFS family permease
MQYRPVKTEDEFFENWVQQYDLLCEKSENIGFIGSMFYLGVMTGVMIFPKASDIYGRLPMMHINLFMQLIAQVGLLFSTNIKHTFIFEFMIGNTCAGVHVVYPNYLNEIISGQGHREITTSMQNLIYDASIIPLAFYY